MSYNTTISWGFGLTFLTIVLAGFFLSFSLQLAAITLGVAFCMNLGLFIICFFKSILNIGEEEDWDIHP